MDIEAVGPFKKALNMISRFTNYIKETQHELYKVNWPTRQQVIRSTVLVIILSLVVAFFLGALDYVFQNILRIFIF